jgi:hypothetical protein
MTDVELIQKWCILIFIFPLISMLSLRWSMYYLKCNSQWISSEWWHKDIRKVFMLLLFHVLHVLFGDWE